MTPNTLLYRIEPPLYVWNDPLDIPLAEGAIGRLAQGHPRHHYATDPRRHQTLMRSACWGPAKSDGSWTLDRRTWNWRQSLSVTMSRG
jgi:hypothetical protein